MGADDTRAIDKPFGNVCNLRVAGARQNGQESGETLEQQRGREAK